MKKFIFYIILSSIVFGETRNWDSHSAYLLHQKRWEMGLFQPFRYGYSESIEYSVHPLWFFIIPNFTLKKYQNPIYAFTTASRYKIFYPTPLLNMVAKDGTLGIIAPDFQIPPMLGLSASLLLSRDIAGFNTTITSGIDLGLVMGELDKRSTIDLPLIYHRLGIFYNGYGIHVGLDVQKSVTTNLSVLTDFDVRFLPGLKGNNSVESKFLVAWKKSGRFRILTGCKLVVGDYPFGTEMRLLPYIPMLEKWVPIIEFQWAGNKS